VVQKLAEEFAYVVIDTSAGLTEHALAMVDISTDLVLVCAMDVSSVRSLRKEVDALDALGMTQQRRHLVVNRADAKVGLDLRDVEATIGQTVDVTLPSSRVVPLSMNQGTPVVESQPRTPVAKQLTSLVARFTGDATNDSGSRRRRRRDGR
jgi:pilus assembly protein CpaE